jgi:hypothetical protein
MWFYQDVGRRGKGLVWFHGLQVAVKRALLVTRYLPPPHSSSHDGAILGWGHTIMRPPPPPPRQIRILPRLEATVRVVPKHTPSWVFFTVPSAPRPPIDSIHSEIRCAPLEAAVQSMRVAQSQIAR